MWLSEALKLRAAQLHAAHCPAEWTRQTYQRPYPRDYLLWAKRRLDPNLTLKECDSTLTLQPATLPTHR